MASDQIYIGLGSNLGNRIENLRAALAMMQDALTSIVEISSVYETEPHGFCSQGDFLNMAARIHTALKPVQLLNAINRIEQALGRERQLKNGPRTIDIDILLYDDQILSGPHLTIPHPRMHLRAFVLVPLAEIAPGTLHPFLKQRIDSLLALCEDSGKVIKRSEYEAISK
ncbi:MAG: 2-amino-4-hydroxy-6-hydroxymethyldihydropteridine diphosphokinase [Saprospiraceae bacterium]|nr:2-amino-4-hydroxy-6-hydroxymethyldihydropteridine diphosphokinase [Saprospiraceae bacterium]